MPRVRHAGYGALWPFERIRSVIWRQEVDSFRSFGRRIVCALASVRRVTGDKQAVG